MGESESGGKCKICGGSHPTGQCLESPRVVIEHGQGEEMDFKKAGSLGVFTHALEEEIRNRGLDVRPAEEGEGFSVFDLLENGKPIGQIQLVHEATAGQPGWAKAFTVNFSGYDGEGLSKWTVGNPEELSRMIDHGIQVIKEYNERAK